MVLLKLFISSELETTLDKVTASIRYRLARGDSEALFAEKEAFQLSRGNLQWTFTFLCPDLFEGLLAFEMLRVELGGCSFTVETETDVSITNALELFNYRIDCSKLLLVDQLRVRKDLKDLVLLGMEAAGVVFLDLASNSVDCALRLGLKDYKIMVAST